MNRTFDRTLVLALGFTFATAPAPADESPPPTAPLNCWVKQSPLAGGPPSPGMGYEASLAYDPVARRVIRWAGHNQGGGGEQNGETWALDPITMRWELKEPNTSPPGACCAQQNVFDPSGGRFLRFPAFSGNHGWQWFREIDLNDSTVWSYDLKRNTWANLRPLPAVRIGPLRCASWDDQHQVAVVFGGEGARDGTLVFDPYTNSWTRRAPRSEPEYRSGGNLAYDPAHGVHILFGAQFIDDPHTWAYNLVRDEWHDMKPASQPPTDRNDAVLAYDAASRSIVAVVRAVDQSEGSDPEQGHLETWTYDVGRNTWTRRKPAREPDGWQNRRRIMVAVPDRGLVLMENFINSTDKIPGVRREQQIWAYRTAEPSGTRVPAPPAAVGVTTDHHAATLAWNAPPSADVTGYIIERGEGPKPWEAELQPIGYVSRDRSGYEDRDLIRGTTYYYAVRAVGSDGKAGPPSPRVRTQPRIVDAAVASVLSPRRVELSWTAAEGRDIAGYHVERAVADVLSDDQVVRLKAQVAPLAEPSVGVFRAVGAFTRLTAEPTRDCTFTDTTIDLTSKPTADVPAHIVRRIRQDQTDPEGKPCRFAVYVYRIRAVNALGIEGGDSPLVPTIPQAPQWLFSREDGSSCDLKWKANPEANLKGYRVYRMESPRANGPGQRVTRLTPEPVSATQYRDDQAAHRTRRYWVVAVDALGQEGFPSAPTWYEREYRAAYAPFVGEWHQ